MMKKLLKILLVILLVAVIAFGLLYFFAGSRIRDAVERIDADNRILQSIVVKPYLFLDNLVEKVREGTTRTGEPVIFKGSKEYEEYLELSGPEYEHERTTPGSYFIYQGRKYANPEIKGLQIPSYMADMQVIDHSPYLALQYDTENKVPVWVAYTLDANKVRNIGLASEQGITEDPVLLGESSSYRTIADAGYSVMPLAPIGETSWSDEALQSALYSTDIVASSMGSSNPWTELSKTLRDYVSKTGDTLYIAAGAVCTSDNARLEDGTVVPGLFWKAVLQYNSDGAKAIAYMVSNIGGKTTASAVSVDQIERLTGLDLFASLPDSIEEMLESQYSLADWNI